MMPLQRRCLIAGCDCPGYAFDMDTYEGTEEVAETERDELKSYCSLCGHAEEEHELAPSDEYRQYVDPMDGLACGA